MIERLIDNAWLIGPAVDEQFSEWEDQGQEAPDYDGKFRLCVTFNALINNPQPRQREYHSTMFQGGIWGRRRRRWRIQSCTEEQNYTDLLGSSCSRLFNSRIFAGRGETEKQKRRERNRGRRWKLGPFPFELPFTLIFNIPVHQQRRGIKTRHINSYCAPQVLKYLAPRPEIRVGAVDPPDLRLLAEN